MNIENIEEAISAVCDLVYPEYYYGKNEGAEKKFLKAVSDNLTEILRSIDDYRGES